MFFSGGAFNLTNDTHHGLIHTEHVFDMCLTIVNQIENEGIQISFFNAEVAYVSYFKLISKQALWGVAFYSLSELPITNQSKSIKNWATNIELWLAESSRKCCTHSLTLSWECPECHSASLLGIKVFLLISLSNWTVGWFTPSTEKA